MTDSLRSRQYIQLDSNEPALIWQYDNARNFEAHWIRSLLPQAARNEHFDFRRYQLLSPNMYVVDNKLTAERLAYIEEARRRGCNVVLLHFGDGAFREDRSVYPLCLEVWRNHWSAEMATLPRVRYLPLG